MSDDDLPVLRRAMAGLAEHGGSTDLYDRTLRTSRRLARRRAIASGGAVAAAVLAIGVPVALAQRQQSPVLPPATVPSADPSVSAEPSTPATTATPRRTVTPAGTTPTRRETTHRPSSPRTSSSSRPPDTGCPVSAATLEDAAGLPAGYRIKPADIRCSQGWATAGVTAPSPEQQGDGVIIFKYTRSTKTWKKAGEGSDVQCADYGMPKSTGLCY
ncbi:hypothetical protein COUCH_10640 [Couchioplanes caeruleus]|uniref:hypothetical protein n=1 Tax=Couchioplanes caeruleus TaxID=56438 RepID=UPI0020C0D4C6|nr:hypothetical protein [Couchioplanes caeruleus]UQU66685.1 hypothetical protein COUCH_10640 [Couchioplanes caeruleus]